MDDSGFQAADAETATPRTLEQLLLAGVGWIAMGAEAADSIADDLARQVGVDRSDMRAAVRDTLESWRQDLGRVGNIRSEATEKALQQLGLVRREEADDLALRVAQIEHRLRLLERPEPPPAA